MLDDANKLQLLFEILDELSSAKGHRDHYKDLCKETKKAEAIRWPQLRTAMSMLMDVEYSAGVMGVCPFCGYKPHHSACEYVALRDSVDYLNMHGVNGYDIDNKPIKGYAERVRRANA